MNATAVIGLLYTAGFDLNLVREHLKTFWWSKTSLYRKRLLMIRLSLDDFCHHPTEIITTLDAARQKYPSKGNRRNFPTPTYLYSYHRLVGWFCSGLESGWCSLPHTQIYGSAREVDHGDVKVEDLANKINKKHQVITVENVSTPRPWQCCSMCHGSWWYPNLWIFIRTSLV